MPYEAGSAYIQVLPSLKGFQNKVASELKGVQAELLVPIKPELDPAAKRKTEQDGAAAAGAFADAFKARLQSAMRSLPKIEITADSTEADLNIATVRAELEALSKKQVGIDIDEAAALAKVAELQAALHRIGQEDTRISVQIDTASAREALDQLQARIVESLSPDTAPEGERAAGAFADAFRGRLEAAIGSLPDLPVRADSAPADQAIAEVRAQLQELSSQQVGINISEADALAKVSALQAALASIRQQDSRISVQLDTAAATAALDEIHAKIVEALAPPDVEPEAERAAGKFADAFKARLETAFAALPDIQIHAHSSEADIIIAEVRTRLDALKDKRVGIDIDEASALAQIAALEAALADVERQHPSVQVRADTAAAMAELAAVRKEATALDHTEAVVEVDDGGSVASTMGGLGGLRGALLGLAPAAIPIASSLIPAIAGVGLASIAAAAGVGVLKLGLSGISEAFQAEQDLNTQTTQNATKNAQQIADAERSLADARQQAADSAITAAERVSSAEQSLADAQRSAAEEVQNALQGQERAEQSLADAQRQALRAQQALNDARQSAARNLQDLQLAAIQADLDQRSATLQLAQAQQALASARANPFAAPGQVEQAQLALDEAQLAAQRAAVQKQRSGEDLSTAQQQGVEGAPGVVSAQDALLNAQQGVANAQQQVANAARALADAQIQAAERVANAQQAVTDAYRQQAQTARQSAEAIARAEEGVASAQNANADAVNKVNTALAALSPAGREFVQFLQQVKPLFDSIGLAAQQALIPGVQAGIQALLPALPAIRDLVAQIAGGIGQLAKGLGEALAGPFWQDFFRTVGQQIVPALQTMGQILGNFAEGGARVFVALLPLANAFGQALEKVSERFVEWAKSPALAQFVDYVQRSVDVVWPLLSAIGDAVLQLLPPLAEWGLAIVKALAPVVEKLLPPLVRLVSDVAGVFTAAWTELAGPLSDLADILAGALTDALNAVEPLLPPLIDVFKTLVRDGVVPLIRDGLRPLIQEALPPLLGLIPQFVPIIKSIGDAFAQILPPLVDVVKTLVEALIPIIQDLAPIVKPLIEAFAALFDFFIKNAVVPILRDWLIPSLQAVADVLKWLVQKVVDPMMKDYAQYSQDAWDALKPIWDAIKNVVSDAAKGWQDGLRDLQAAWDTLEKIVGTPVKAVIDLTYNDGLVPMWNQMAFLVGAPQIRKIDTSGIPHFAGGGVLPGYAPGRDSVLAKLSPGEAVLVPELVQAIGPANILAMNAAFGGRPAAAAGVPMFAGGGLVDTVLGLSGQAGNSALTDPLGALSKATGSNSSLVQLLAQIPTQLLSKAAGYLWAQFTALGANQAGASKGVGAALAGNGQLDSWIAAAIAFAGVPASWASGLRTLIMRESGGNPRAINNWDINAQRGDPSRGLMQTIGSTFNAYRDPRLSADIYDPVANIVAGIRYIIARYGDISRVQQANPNLPPMGYDSGGYLPPGLSTVFNGTGRPEPVFTQAQFAALANAPAFPTDGWEISGELTVDGMDARIDGRIQQAGSRTGTAIAQRSRI